MVDLAEVALPFMDERHHPRLAKYEHEHTKAWSATVSRADAFVFVTPEYNYGYNAVLNNAIDYLHKELADKPLGLRELRRCRGGHPLRPAARAGGQALRMVPVVESVNVPFAAQFWGTTARCARTTS